MKSKHTNQTEQAWKTVYTRLENDGLIKSSPEDNPEANRTIIYRPKSVRLPGKWEIAGLVALLLLTIYVHWPTENKPIDKNLLTIRNETGSGTLVKTLEDGSFIYLSDYTELIYPDHFAPDKRVVSLKGNALFEVTGNKEHPFLIHTSYTDIEVIGTSFEIKSFGEDMFTLSVLEGEVKVMIHQTKEEIYVRAHETILVSPDGKWKQEETDNAEIWARMTQTIRFKDEWINNILYVINKTGTGYPIIADPAFENRRLTVSFSGNTPEEIAGLLATALETNYYLKNDTLMISD